MPTAVEVHDLMVAEYEAQRARLFGREAGADIWSGRTAERFRDNPRRPLDPVLERIASYLRPEDVLLDIGGGAGRLGLPLALRCKELINVDPSPGMRALFEEIAGGAGITNARFIQSGWLEAPETHADVALVAHVTYFVPDIASFLSKTEACARRRVIVNTNSVPPPNTTARMFELVYSEPQALVPSHVQLLEVLKERGLEAEVTTIDLRGNERAGALAIIPDRTTAIDNALIGPWLRPGAEDRIRAIVEAHFEELFATVEGGYIRRAGQDARPVLITWEPKR
jgi:hypothetical protein